MQLVLHGLKVDGGDPGLPKIVTMFEDRIVLKYHI